MDNQEYRIKGKEMIDFVGDYLRDIRQQRVFPNVKPGYMRKLVPDHAPLEGEAWDNIMDDIKTIILPGVTHWQSPYMHAYFPALTSYPSLLGDMIADAINCLGFTWASSPACTELETIVMDWLGKMIGLPSDFLHSNTATSGGGVIQTTASEATFISILAARTEAIRKVQDIYPDKDDSEINGRLIAYCSDQAHSSVEKAGLIGLVRMRYLASDDNLSLRGDILRAAIIEDRETGFIPFYLCASLGTTGACAFDNLAELGPICQLEEIYLHIDAAYAGTAFICPEYRFLMDGVEYAQSFAFNPSKWLMVHFDCTAMWIKDSTMLHRTFNVDPLYLKHENSGEAIDYMHWQIGLSKRFRALKLWCVLRSFGISGLQKHVRKGIELAKMMENLILSNPNFEIPAKRYLGMIVFRLKGENELTETLLKSLNSSGQLHMVPASLKGTYIIRFTVTSQFTTEEDIARDWNIIMVGAREVVIKQGGLWIEEIEEDVEVEISEDESGLGDELQYTSKEGGGTSGESDALTSDAVPSPVAAKKGIMKRPTDGRQDIPPRPVSGIPTNQLSGSPEDRPTVVTKPRRTKIVPRKQMSVVFDPRASARRRATAAVAASYMADGTAGKTGRFTSPSLGDTSQDGTRLTARRGSNFGVSLLLSNTPHSPQFINGSYAAIFENPQVVDDIASHLRRLQTEYSPWRQGPPPTKITDGSPMDTPRAKLDIELFSNSKKLEDVDEEGSPTGTPEGIDVGGSNKTLNNDKHRASSSVLFKKAIENLFGSYDKSGEMGAGTYPTNDNLLSSPHRAGESRRAAFKRLAPGRQYSLDSRLNFYSRAINDISAAAKVVQGEGGSLRPQRRDYGSGGNKKIFDRTSEGEEDDSDDRADTRSGCEGGALSPRDKEDVSSPGDDLGGRVATDDYASLASCFVKDEDIEKGLENNQQEGVFGPNRKSIGGASLRRRRRIIDPPSHVPALPKGGISSAAHEDLTRITLEKVLPRDNVGVQVEESMLPYEDQSFSSQYITSPNYVGKHFNNRSCQDGAEQTNFHVNPNEKMVEANVGGSARARTTVKKQLVRMGTKLEKGESKDLEWESSIPVNPRNNYTKDIQYGSRNNSVGFCERPSSFKRSSSNNNLHDGGQVFDTHANYSDWNRNNNNIHNFESYGDSQSHNTNETPGLSNISGDEPTNHSMISSPIQKPKEIDGGGNGSFGLEDLNSSTHFKKEKLLTKLGRFFTFYSPPTLCPNNNKTDDLPPSNKTGDQTDLKDPTKHKNHCTTPKKLMALKNVMRKGSQKWMDTSASDPPPRLDGSVYTVDGANTTQAGTNGSGSSAPDSERAQEDPKDSYDGECERIALKLDRNNNVVVECTKCGHKMTTAPLEMMACEVLKKERAEAISPVITVGDTY